LKVFIGELDQHFTQTQQLQVIYILIRRYLQSPPIRNVYSHCESMVKVKDQDKLYWMLSTH